MRQANLRIRVVGVCLCVAGLTLMLSCSKKPEQQQERQAYETLKVSTTDRRLDMKYSAAIRGKQDVAIVPQVGGTITRTCVTEGQTVAKGQTLFVIDQVPFLAALRTAKANVEAARAGLETARLDYESKQELYKQQVVSEFTLKTAHNAYLTAKAALSQAEAAQTNAQNSLGYTEVKAPSAGVVGQLPYRTGTLVSPQMPEPLTTVSDNSEMWVYFSMTEQQLIDLARDHQSMREAVDAMPRVALELKDGTLYADSGRVVSISGVIDQQTGTVTCRAEFGNGRGLLHSGQSGQVLIPHQYHDVIVIPQSAAVQQQDKYLVYKVVDGRAKGQLVTVEPISNGREFIVREGLSAGDVIVARGAGLLREGMEIK